MSCSCENGLVCFIYAQELGYCWRWDYSVHMGQCKPLQVQMCRKDSFSWPVSGSWAVVYAVLLFSCSEPCKFTSFCFAFLFSNHGFMTLLHATHIIKPQKLEVFPVLWCEFHYLPHWNTCNAKFLCTEQRLFKGPPISFKIACVMFCTMSFLSSVSCDEGARKAASC